MSKGKHHWGHEPCSSRDHRAVLSYVQRSGVITRSLNSHTYISSIAYNTIISTANHINDQDTSKKPKNTPYRLYVPGEFEI